MYSIEHDPRTGVASVIRDRDGARIPQDPRNADFVEFMVWNAEQVEPLDLTPREPAAEPAVKTPEELAAEFMAIDADSTKRQPFWDALLSVFWLRMSQEQPEVLEELVNLALQATGKGRRFQIRKTKV